MNYLNIKDEDLLKVVVELNTLLADYHIYYQKLRSNHWNILGKNFFDLHLKFEELYTDARVKIDEIAERILTLKYHPMSKLEDYLKVSSNSVSDEGTIDLIGAYIRELEKYSWMLDAWSKDTTASLKESMIEMS